MRPHRRNPQEAGDRWIERPELDNEVPSHEQRADGEDDVARQAHPLPDQRLIIEGDAARVGEAVLVNSNELRPSNREEVEQDPERQPGIVQPEGPQPELLAERRSLAREIAQAEIDEADREQAESAEERRMGMVQR